MDFSLSDELCELRERTRQFIAEQIIPLERDAGNTEHGPSEVHRWSIARKLVGRRG